MMQKKNGMNNACASCKHQRKKCTEKCILAPLFPAEKANEFQAVHRVFGVSNLTKIVKNLPRDDDRRRAAQSLYWEAYWRRRDPILGPYGEYKRVSDELRLYKNQFQVSNMYQNSVSPQGGVTPTMCKSHAATTPLSDWNNNIGDINHSLNYIHDIGSVVNFYPDYYGYFTQVEDQLNSEKGKKEVLMNSGCPVVLPHHQPPANNGFNH